MTHWYFEYEHLLRVLIVDLKSAEDRLRMQDSQTNRRVLIRTLLTVVEVLFNRFRVWTLDMIQAGAAEETESDPHVPYPLLGDVARIRANGTTGLTPQRIPLSRHIAYTIRAHCKHKGIDAERYIGDNGWSQLQEAIRVRNRLTHPKSAEELEVTDDELIVARSGVEWFRGAMQMMYQVILEAESTDGTR